MSSLFLSLLLLVGQAAADDTVEKLKVCAAIEDSAARLACFDAIGRTSAPEPATVTVSEPDAPVPEPITEPEPAPEPVPEPEPVIEPEPPAAGTVGSVESIDAPDVSPATEVAGSAAAEEMGADTIAREEKRQQKQEKKKKERNKREIVTATIVRVTPQLDGRWTVTLDNGQVWRETQGSKVGIPKEGASVELSKGRFGGYRMSIDGLYRTAWVQRKQ